MTRTVLVLAVLLAAPACNQPAKTASAEAQDAADKDELTAQDREAQRQEEEVAKIAKQLRDLEAERARSKTAGKVVKPEEVRGAAGKPGLSPTEVEEMKAAWAAKVAEHAKVRAEALRAETDEDRAAARKRVLSLSREIRAAESEMSIAGVDFAPAELKSSLSLTDSSAPPAG